MHTFILYKKWGEMEQWQWNVISCSKTENKPRCWTIPLNMPYSLLKWPSMRTKWLHYNKTSEFIVLAFCVLTCSPSLTKSFLQIWAIIPVARASPITLTMVLNRSLNDKIIHSVNEAWKNKISHNVKTMQSLEFMGLRGHLVHWEVQVYAVHYNIHNTPSMELVTAV